jgi:tol-pal system protein YbgF
VLEPQSPRSLRDDRQLSGARAIPGALAALLAALLAAGGCASRADIERVKRDQQEMRARLADVQVSLDSMKRQLDTMRTAGDDQRSGQSSATIKALERRVADLESRGGPPPTPAEGGPVAAIPPPAVPSPAAPSMPHTEAATIALRREDRQPATATNDAYRRALQSYRDGQTTQAIQQFRDYLRANPKSDLSDNAQYWIGEAYYSKGDYNRSIIELNEVLLKYPQGDQVPGALLALATSFSNSGDKIDAKLILQKLISDHPKSEEAEIGRQQLQTLSD